MLVVSSSSVDFESSQVKAGFEKILKSLIEMYTILYYLVITFSILIAISATSVSGLLQLETKAACLVG